MTTKTRVLASCAGLLVAFTIGRYSARAPDTIVDERAEETRHETAKVEESATVEATVAKAEAETARVEETRERIRVVFRERETRPDGSTHERELELDAETARLTAELAASREEVARLEAAAARAEAREILATRIDERRVEVHTPLPDWIAGPMLGVDVGGLRPVYGGMGAYRIGGPVHLGAWLTTTGKELQVGGGLLAAW